MAKRGEKKSRYGRGSTSRTRKTGERRYKKMFIVSTEGARTEPLYLKWIETLNPQNAVSGTGPVVIPVRCLPSKDKSSPNDVLKRMQEYIQKNTLRPGDEAWIVVDKDKWTDEQLTKLLEWSRETPKNRAKRGFALTNPQFEYWLLLHFEDAKQVTASNVINTLQKYDPAYDKKLDVRKYPLENIQKAVERARHRDKPPCTSWPKKTGTTVYRLIDTILNA